MTGDYITILFGILFVVSEVIGFVSKHKGIVHFVFTYGGNVYSVDVRGDDERDTLLEGENGRRRTRGSDLV